MSDQWTERLSEYLDDELSPEERAALWPRLVDLYADFQKYDAWTEREIPVVVLTPR